MKNSPRQSKVAGPVRNTSLFHSTVCIPPGACTRTGDFALPVWIEATAAAQEPVPEDMVSPTPRSQKRTSISSSVQDFDELDIHSVLEIVMREICSATACQPNSNCGTKTTKCGLPMETGVPVTSP